MGKEQVLLYHLNKEKRNVMEKVCLQLGIKIKYIQAEQYHLPIGLLLIGTFAEQEKGIEKKGRGVIKNVVMERNRNDNRETEEILDEMMIMDGFSSARMDRFLERMKKAEISGIELKAVVTEYNKGWNSVQLYQELKKEQKKFQQKKF